MLWLDLFAKLLHIMRIPKYRNGIILYYPRLLFRPAIIYLKSKSAAFHSEFGSNIIIDEEAVSQSFKQRHPPPAILRRQKLWYTDDYVSRACELKELTLIEESTGYMDEEDLLGILELLAKWKMTNLKSTSPAARLYSLTLGPWEALIHIRLSQIAIARVVETS